MIFGVATQVLHLLIVPETRTTICLDQIAKKRRQAGESNLYGPNELRPFKERFSAKEILQTWARPFVMFATEPIVLFCSLLSGFSDALIFTFLEAYTPVYAQWGFTTQQMSLAFVPYVPFFSMSNMHAHRWQPGHWVLYRMGELYPTTPTTKGYPEEGPKSPS